MSLSLQMLSDLPNGTIIQPHEQEPPLIVALKLTPMMWTVTGYAHVVHTKDLFKFANEWEGVN